MAENTDFPVAHGGAQLTNHGVRNHRPVPSEVHHSRDATRGLHAPQASRQIETGKKIIQKERFGDLNHAFSR